MIRRVYVEKREGFDIEAEHLRSDLAGLCPEFSNLVKVRILRRYDVDGLDEEQFKQAAACIFSEPQCDRVYFGEQVPAEGRERYFAAAYLPGQFDQRSDSAQQCAELVFGAELRGRPIVRCASVYLLRSKAAPFSEAALAAAKKHLINPVDSHEVSHGLPASLEEPMAPVRDVPVIDGFCGADKSGLEKLARDLGLAMSVDDLLFCQTYFASEDRDPTLAELRVLDTYWSDHCRHTTFTTELTRIDIEAAPDNQAAQGIRRALGLYEKARRECCGTERPVSLMDMATIGARLLKKHGLLDDLDESDEINACTVKVQAEFSDGSAEPWLLLFKNETHNHPTEIEPFGGAATCLGGAIRDPLSGRAFVHQAMRVTGCGDPRARETLAGKLPQSKIARESARGYSSYGNQIGLATGQVAEFYHAGFVAKHLELGAVIAAVPEAWVRRETPAAGDAVILVGGKTGRDGIGGATGSSKAHTGESVEKSGAEVQKGNAVEERKIQRLFRNPAVTRLIKKCNDFGAGGVAVAVGELADALDIDLDAVPKKYAGLDGIELAISESQERMACVVAAEDAAAFIRAAAAENLDAVVIAVIGNGGEAEAGKQGSREDEGSRGVLGSGDWGTERGASGLGSGEHRLETGKPRLRMFWRGQPIVDLSRDFLNSNGAPRSTSAAVSSSSFSPLISSHLSSPHPSPSPHVLLDELERELTSLRSGSRRGLQERFDGSIGAGAVLFPFGGAEQGTPECGMAALLPELGGCDRDGRAAGRSMRTASLMSFGFDPDLMSACPYEGAKAAIREALAKFACLGGNPWKARLSLQEFFERPSSPESWSRPASALLGALEAQLELGVPAIGGKDSMSGTYIDEAHGVHLTVPPTLVAFAAGTVPAAKVRSGALSGERGNTLALLYQMEASQTEETEASDTDQTGALGTSAHQAAVSQRDQTGLPRKVSRSGQIGSPDTSSRNGASGLSPAGGDEWACFKANMNALAKLREAGLVRAAYPVGAGGIAATLAVMAFGSMAGVEVQAAGLAPVIPHGSVLVELAALAETAPAQAALDEAGAYRIIGKTIAEPIFRVSEGEDVQEAPLAMLRRAYEYPLSEVYPQITGNSGEGERKGEAADEPRSDLDERGTESGGSGIDRNGGVKRRSEDYGARGSRVDRCGVSGASLPLGENALPPSSLSSPAAAPLAVLPVFPGTNCEWDMERSFRKAGARTRLVIFRNNTREAIAESIAELAAAIDAAQIVALSGGFSAGDEPDGSGKFIANVFRAPRIMEAVTDLLGKRDGLMLGICNGFQALVKLGLVPYGEYREGTDASPTLTFNSIGRHISRMVRTRVMSALSPWLALEEPGAVHVVPVSHGEGRFVIGGAEGIASKALFKTGQVAFCYADGSGDPTMAEPDNPNGSRFAIEGITSPDGRVLGKMAHSERCGEYVHINIPGNKQQRIFEAGVNYFK